METLKNTKFIACLVGTLALVLTALLGKFTGELGLAVSGIVVAFMTGNVLNTRAALANGKNGEA